MHNDMTSTIYLMKLWAMHSHRTEFAAGNATGYAHTRSNVPCTVRTLIRCVLNLLEILRDRTVPFSEMEIKK